MKHTDILLVEDNPMNQRLLLRQLGHLGIREVAVVNNGSEALDWLSARSCRLVLADCQMPGMDGYEMARRIRSLEAVAIPSLSRLPILALTASALDEDKAVCLAAGMDDHIAKPASLDRLRHALQPWFGELAADSGERV